VGTYKDTYKDTYKNTYKDTYKDTYKVYQGDKDVVKTVRLILVGGGEKFWVRVAVPALHSGAWRDVRTRTHTHTHTHTPYNTHTYTSAAAFVSAVCVSFQERQRGGGGGGGQREREHVCVCLRERWGRRQSTDSGKLRQVARSSDTAQKQGKASFAAVYHRASL